MLANHPDREQIRLENLLNALGNPLRLAVVRALAAGHERACGSLLQGQSKSTMTHHWRVLRDSGVIWQRPDGRENLLSLRRHCARSSGMLRARQTFSGGASSAYSCTSSRAASSVSILLILFIGPCP